VLKLKDSSSLKQEPSDEKGAGLLGTCSDLCCILPYNHWQTSEDTSGRDPSLWAGSHSWRLGRGRATFCLFFFFFYQTAWRRSAFTNSSKISALEMSQPKRQTRNQQQHLFLERTAVRSKCQQAKLRVRNHTQVDSSSKESFYWAFRLGDSLIQTTSQK